jgi:adenylyl-sulfate kinase
MTGLSGAGKSTLANALEEKLNQLGKHTYILDGDNLRHGLNQDLGFSMESRNENVRRAAEVARLMVDAGLIVIVALISPLKTERDHARSLFTSNQFKEIYLSTRIQECEKRDVKGLYQKARAGELKDFTGIDSPYEPPEAPEIELNTEILTVDQAVDKIIKVIL